jgi:hypothetical protein
MTYFQEEIPSVRRGHVVFASKSKQKHVGVDVRVRVGTNSMELSPS